jgi:DNA repair exonuclease SbcCD ATPase subunit
MRFLGLICLSLWLAGLGAYVSVDRSPQVLARAIDQVNSSYHSLGGTMSLVGPGPIYKLVGAYVMAAATLLLFVMMWRASRLRRVAERRLNDLANTDPSPQEVNPNEDPDDDEEDEDRERFSVSDYSSRLTNIRDQATQALSRVKDGDWDDFSQSVNEAQDWCRQAEKELAGLSGRGDVIVAAKRLEARCKRLAEQLQSIEGGMKGQPDALVSTLRDLKRRMQLLQLSTAPLSGLEEEMDQLIEEKDELEEQKLHIVLSKLNARVASLKAFFDALEQNDSRVKFAEQVSKLAEASAALKGRIGSAIQVKEQLDILRQEMSELDGRVDKLTEKEADDDEDEDTVGSRSGTGSVIRY